MTPLSHIRHANGDKRFPFACRRYYRDLSSNVPIPVGMTGTVYLDLLDPDNALPQQYFIEKYHCAY